jgi:hypothetical protein
MNCLLYTFCNMGIEELYNIYNNEDAMKIIYIVKKGMLLKRRCYIYEAANYSEHLEYNKAGNSTK